MFFNKSERKSGHPVVALTIGALAVFGAFSMVSSGKRWVCDKSRKMVGYVKGMVGTDSEYGE